MKRLSFYLLTIAGIFAIAAGCEKQDIADFDPDKTVPDPEGTVSISMRNGNSGGTYLDDYFYIDRADNFSGGHFVSLGKVKGLGNISFIPHNGWSEKVAVVPGEGYVAHYQRYGIEIFYRIYVVGYTLDFMNNIIGADIKYQKPFLGSGKISLPKDSITFDCNGGETTLEFGTDNNSIVPFSAEVVSDDPNAQAATCRVVKNPLSNSITVYAEENTTHNDIRHKIVIKTLHDGTEQEIAVTVKSVTPYISLHENYDPTIVMPANTSTKPYAFMILTNIAPEDILTKSDSWITVTQVGTNTDGVLYSVTCQENPTDKEREGKITVYTDKYKNVSTEIKVVQNAHTLELSSDSVQFDRLVHSTAVTVTTTASVFSTKSDSESWCTPIINDNIITIRAAANDTSKDRTANIIVKLDIGQSRSISVYQSRYTAGDSYDTGGVKGKVFDIYYRDGFHGKIVSLDTAEKAWSTENVGTGATDKDDGMKNMEKIKAIPDWHTLYPAFAWCADHGSGWYLPSYNELYLIYDKKLLREYSWSSTEHNDREVWYVPRYYNDYTDYKSNVKNVCAVRVF